MHILNVEEWLSNASLAAGLLIIVHFSLAIVQKCNSDPSSSSTASLRILFSEKLYTDNLIIHCMYTRKWKSKHIPQDIRCWDHKMLLSAYIPAPCFLSMINGWCYVYINTIASKHIFLCSSYSKSALSKKKKRGKKTTQRVRGEIKRKQ